MQIVDLEENVVPPSEGAKRLNRQKWHKPLISIVVTHHNYSAHLEDGLLSILDQTHENWECIIVDDASTSEHRAAAETIVNNVGCTKIRFFALQENVGQIPAFFSGLDQTTGEFVCILDPDDRYDATFLEEMLKVHLNESIFCPIACCDQRLMKNNVVLSGANSRLKRDVLTRENDLNELPAKTTDRLFYIPPDKGGWHWTSSSSMMFRRSALAMLRPNKILAYKMQFDAYTAPGAHRLGGTLFLTKPLVYRGVHDANGYLTNNIFASTQRLRGPQIEANEASQCWQDVLDAINHNGGGPFLPTRTPPIKQRGITARWRRSIEKRLRILKGISRNQKR